MNDSVPTVSEIAEVIKDYRMTGVNDKFIVAEVIVKYLENRLIMKCPDCGNDLTEQIAGTLTPEEDNTYVRVHCECCGYTK